MKKQQHKGLLEMRNSIWLGPLIDRKQSFNFQRLNVIILTILIQVFLKHSLSNYFVNFEKHFLKAAVFHPLQHPSSLKSRCFKKFAKFSANSSKPCFSALFGPNAKKWVFLKGIFSKHQFFAHFKIQAA